ncbi:DNA-binding response regulator [Clostridia bacterium]|nr:DNA-binding response regulator [Clostridia bacterium]
MFTILVAEDDAHLRRLICASLTQNGYRALPAEHGEAALEALDREHVDLLIADIMMPRMDGYALTRALREAGLALPILMVTAREQLADKRRGFELGADDYMVKPVDLDELALRVAALLRRARIATEKRLALGDVVLDWGALSVDWNGRTETLPPKEFYLLFMLLSYLNIIFTRRQLLDELWGMENDVDERTVDVHIRRLRERYQDCGAFEIVTVRGLGYKAVRRP